MWDVGDVYPTSVVVRGADGEPADATAVRCTATAPDGAAVDLPVQRTGPGCYRTGVAVSMPGLWSVDWRATGLNASAYSDAFSARDPAAVPVLSLGAAKEFLNIAGSESDEELRGFLDAVTAKGEEITGRVFGRRTVVADLPGAPGAALALGLGPVLRLVSVAGDGQELDPAGVTASAAAVLYRSAGWAFARVRVSYVAGYALQPPSDVMGAKMLLKWLWQSQRGSVRRAAAGEWAPGDGWDIPNAVMGQWRDSIVTGFA